VVTFDDYVEVLFPSELVTNKQSMKDLISRVAARGSTALHKAWVRGGMSRKKLAYAAYSRRSGR
jgi:hypothetical protein